MYLFSVVVVGLSGSFGDLGVVVPSLLIKLEAPGWLVSFPMVATMSIAYLPVLPMGWWLKAGMSRRKLYMVTCGVACATLLVMIVPLYAGATREQMLACVFASMLAYSLAVGLTILPCWDLLARLFAEKDRARLVSIGQGMAQVCALFSGALGGWILSPAGPFEYPMSYAVSLTLFLLGALLYIACVWGMHEPRAVQEEEATEGFGAYLKGLAAMPLRDRAFGRTVVAGCAGGMIVAVGPMALAYATRHRGFDPAWVGWLVGLKPCVAVPMVLVVTKLSKQVTAQMICVILAVMTTVGLLMLLVCWGVWQLAALMLVGQSFLLYAFCVLAVMRHAGTGQTHRHLTVFYTAAATCGLAPIALGWLMDRQPTLAVAVAAGIAAVTAGMFWRINRLERGRAEF